MTLICDLGTSWAIVDPPKKNLAVAHVSVGMYVVWAVTKDNKVSLSACSH